MTKKHIKTLRKHLKNRHNRPKEYEAWFIPGCLLIGIGIGIKTGDTGAYTLVGLGVGFLITVTIYLLRKKK